MVTLAELDARIGEFKKLVERFNTSAFLVFYENELDLDSKEYLAYTYPEFELEHVTAQGEVTRMSYYKLRLKA